MKEPRAISRSLSHWYFTLVELLIVIAIMGILTSLLLPALGKAKKTALGIACANNLKQIGMAYACYRDDYDNYFHPNFGNAGYASPLWNHSLLRWNPEHVGIHHPTGGYLTVRSLFCPSLPYHEKINGDDAWKYWISYGINHTLIGYSHNAYAINHYKSGRASKVQSPSLKFFICDTAQCSDGAGGTYDDRGFWRWVAGVLGTSHGIPSARHSGHSVNMLYLDGHSDAVKPLNRALPYTSAPFKWGDVANSQIHLDVLDKRW